MSKLVFGVVLCMVGTAAAAQQTRPAELAVSKTTSATGDTPQLVIARRITLKLMPDGTYRRMMGGMTDRLLASTTDQMLEMPIRDLAAFCACSKENLHSLGPATLKQVLAIVDPAYEQRLKLGTRAMMASIVDLMSSMEPSVREGLAQAYASRFSAGELEDLDAYFSTSTGQHYASESMAIYGDPALVERMQAVVPKIMAAMPTLAAKMRQATAALPEPRKLATLSKPERDQLSKLLKERPVNVK